MNNNSKTIESTRIYYAIDVYLTQYIQNDASTYTNKDELIEMLLDSNVFFENNKEINELFEGYAITPFDYINLVESLVNLGYNPNQLNIKINLNYYLKEFIICFANDLFQTFLNFN